MTYSGFYSSDVLLRGAPQPVGSPPLHQALARGVGSAIVPTVRANPVAFTSTGPLVVLGVVIVAAPFAREAWERFLGEAIPVTWEVPAPLIPANSVLFWSCTSQWKIKSNGQIITDTKNGSAGRYNSIVRGAYLDTSGNPRVAFRAQPVGGGAVQTIPLSDSYNNLYEFMGISGVSIAPVSGGQSAPVEGAPIVQLPSGPVPTLSPTMTIPIGQVPGLIPSPVNVPVLIPNPGEITEHPIPIIPIYPTPVPREPLRIPPMWLLPDGLQIGNPPALPPAAPIIVGVPPTLTETEIQRERQRRGTPCIPCPDDGGGCDCDDIRKIVEEELDDKFPPKRPVTQKTITFPSANSRSISLPPYTRKLILTLTQIPTDARTQWGADAPDVVYAGWNAFNTGERTPVSYENNTYFPPSQAATSWSYTLQRGFEGSVLVYYDEGV